MKKSKAQATQVSTRITFLLIVALFANVLLFTSCDEPNDNSQNNYHNGIEQSTQDKNDHESKENSGKCMHDYTLQYSTETCTTDGFALYKCRKCGDEYKEDVYASGHSLTNGICDYCGTCIDYEPYAEWISNRSFEYNNDDSRYQFCFALKDVNDAYISCDATVELYIENENGEKVYKGTKHVGQDDYSTWYNAFNEWWGTAVYIYENEMTPGSSEDGTLYYKVIAGDNWFEYTLDISGILPTIDYVDLCHLTLPKLPYSISDQTDDDWLITKITSIEYYFEESYDNKVNLKLSFAGERTDVDLQENVSKYCEIGWKLVDEEGYVIDTGTVYSPALAPGDKFKNVEETIYGLEAGNYTLTIIGVID